ncbi:MULTISPECIES: HAD family hydrolase [Salimicrobium]|uniref:HAD family hydrolase n=1 Tax=Salimicrobium humidisoli TaxID=2029857 RepID=A0ABX4HTM0_9BACI|nr:MULTISPECIES: HAD family hydrolase [Salimicrobium]PBB06574.1 HAD family hydrolase [Salimicrobium humidisoli]
MDSIIFDLDGTLWDPISTVKDAWNETIQAHRPEEKELSRKDMESIMGLQTEGVVEKLFPHLDQDEGEKIIHNCFEAEIGVIKKQGGELYEGVERTLQHLYNNYPLFIVSNCQDGYIEAFLQAHQLEKYFKDFENPGRTGLSKGENIQLVMKRNDLNSPIYVGDTSGDKEAAQNAGLPFYYASYGFGEVDRAEQTIETFTDLQSLL